MRTFHDRIHAVKQIIKGYVQERNVEAPQELTRQEEIGLWASQKSREALEVLDSVVKEDGYRLAELALSYPDIMPIPQ